MCDSKWYKVMFLCEVSYKIKISSNLPFHRKKYVRWHLIVKKQSTHPNVNLTFHSKILFDFIFLSPTHFFFAITQKKFLFQSNFFKHRKIHDLTIFQLVVSWRWQVQCGDIFSAPIISLIFFFLNWMSQEKKIFLRKNKKEEVITW